MGRSRNWPRIVVALAFTVALAMPAATVAQEAPAVSEPALVDPTGPTGEGLPAITGQAYYVDCGASGDGGDGKDPARAWVSLGRANNADLQPGDALLLRRNCNWKGPLVARWSGTEASPIVIGTYGEGERPLIQNSTTQIVVTGSYMLIDNMRVRSDGDTPDTKCQNNPIGNRTGVSFEAGATFNTLRNSVITDLASGVHLTTRAHHNRLLHNEMSNNIMMFDDDPWRNDGGAQAILLQGDFNEIAYNDIFGSMACSSRYGWDGTAIELYGGQNNAIHHNSTWNNANFTEVSLPRTTTNVFAYNLVNGHSALTVHDGTQRTIVYNNVFYSTGGSGDNGVVCQPCGSNVMTFKNNIVWGQGALSTGGSGAADEGYNIYWSSNGHPYLDGPISPTSQVADPMFVNPGVDFHLTQESPAVGAGSMETVGLGWQHDLHLLRVPQREAPSVGVYELP